VKKSVAISAWLLFLAKAENPRGERDVYPADKEYCAAFLYKLPGDGEAQTPEQLNTTAA
jgi:hypothetical protein